MMLSPTEYKSIKREFATRFKDMLETEFYSDLQFSFERPTCVQYWKVDLFYCDYDGKDGMFVNTIGYFYKTQEAPDGCTINVFFKSNEDMIDEFHMVYNQCLFSKLMPAFELVKEKEAEKLEKTFLAIESYSNLKDPTLREICQEPILVICIAGDTITIECTCSERVKIKVTHGDYFEFYEIPYEKESVFRNAERVEGYYNNTYYEYQVALSFAGEERKYVEAVADYLKKDGIRVFYDFYEEAELWGKDLYVHLDNIYRKKSKYCVLFISKDYKEKVWTNHERQSAQARAFEEHGEYILPVKLDDTEIEGIRPTLGYVDGLKKTPEEIAELIKKKIVRS